MSIDDLSKLSGNIDSLAVRKPLNQNRDKITVNNGKLSGNDNLHTNRNDSTGFIHDDLQGTEKRGLVLALSNISENQATLSLAGKGLNDILDALQAMRDKAALATGDTLNRAERDTIDAGLDKLAVEINLKVNNTISPDGTKLLDGSFSGEFNQYNAGDDNVITISIPNGHDTKALSVDNENINVSSASAANESLENIENAIKTVQNSIQSVNAFQDRLLTSQNAVTTALTNSDSSKNRIEDDVMLKEQLENTKNNILNNINKVMVTQANASPQNVMSLL